MKKQGVVSDKQEFWHQFNLADLESAGAFVPREIWDGYVIKKDASKIKITPRNYAK
jgi:hypothetical protein